MLNSYICLLPFVLASLTDARLVNKRRLPKIQARQSGVNLPVGVDLGSCSDPTLIFAVGLDNRRETSFEPNNLQEFAHTSAQNPAIITQFICDTFVNSCGANQAAKDLCAQAKTATAVATKNGATADQWNAFWGATTNFAAITPIDDQGNVASALIPNGAAAATSAGDAVVTTTATATVKTACAAATNQAAAATSATQAAATSGGNLQTFTGALGGAAAPAVTAGGRGFVVAGSDDFLNVGAALGRSCDIQHNQCANKANSSGGFSVGDCDQQNNQCHAATSA